LVCELVESKLIEMTELRAIKPIKNNLMNNIRLNETYSNTFSSLLSEDLNDLTIILEPAEYAYSSSFR
jgi:hypothetical protein